MIATLRRPMRTPSFVKCVKFCPKFCNILHASCNYLYQSVVFAHFSVVRAPDYQTIWRNIKVLLLFIYIFIPISVICILVYSFLLGSVIS